MQVVDDVSGPKTKREYERVQVPAGPALVGRLVDFLGRPPGSQDQLGNTASMPLFNDPLDMESR